MSVQNVEPPQASTRVGPHQRIREWALRQVHVRPAYVSRDLRNLWRFGPDAPLWAKRTWVDPHRLTRMYEFSPRSYSGRSVGGEWDRSRSWPTLDHDIIVAALRHWSDGVTWEEAGAYAILQRRIADRGSAADGCRTMEDVVARFDRLDAMFEQMRREGRLRSRADLSRRCVFREPGGVLVNIGRDGPVFGGQGCHRLSAALVLGLRRIPMQLVVVHEEVLTTWRTVPGIVAPTARRSGGGH